MRKQTTLEMQRLTVEQYKEAEKMPLAIVLDDVRSLHNVGSVFRTADSFRAEKVCLCGITAQPPAPEIHKTALGAEESVAWQHYANAVDCVNALHEQGYMVFAVEQCHGSTMLQDLVLPPIVDAAPTGNDVVNATETKKPSEGKALKYAVVLGNEVRGVHQEVVDLCDGCIEIPQLGTKHSLNVSVTAGIIIWEFARQLLFSKQ